MTINERILALRRAAGLSQEALAEQVGVSRQAIGKWESGASLPGLDNLQELARALGVSCDELLTGKESGTENTAGQDGVALESVKACWTRKMRRRPHAAHRQRILLAGLARRARLRGCGAGVPRCVLRGPHAGAFQPCGRHRRNVAGIEGSIDMRISSIQSSIEESLRQQASIVAGFDWDYGVPGTERRVPLTVTATPKNYRDGLSAVFTLTPESGVPQTAAGTLLAGNAFRAELAVPLEMEYQDFSVSVSFTLDGEAQTEELFREYDFVSGYQTTVSVTPMEFKAQHSGRRTDGTAGMTLGGDFELSVNRAYRENSAVPAHAMIELVIDGEAVQRQEMDLSADFQLVSGGAGTADEQAEEILSGITTIFPSRKRSTPHRRGRRSLWPPSPTAAGLPSPHGGTCIVLVESYTPNACGGILPVARRFLSPAAFVCLRVRVLTKFTFCLFSSLCAAGIIIAYVGAARLFTSGTAEHAPSTTGAMKYERLFLRPAGPDGQGYHSQGNRACGRAVRCAGRQRARDRHGPRKAEKAPPVFVRACAGGSVRRSGLFRH